MRPYLVCIGVEMTYIEPFLTDFGHVSVQGGSKGSEMGQLVA